MSNVRFIKPVKGESDFTFDGLLYKFHLEASLEGYHVCYSVEVEGEFDIDPSLITEDGRIIVIRQLVSLDWLDKLLFISIEQKIKIIIKAIKKEYAKLDRIRTNIKDLEFKFN